jgi:hypothetical protein
MNSVERTKAGVGSGILSMSRMVGGTFGVAVLGALVSTLGSSKLQALLPNLPAGTRDAVTAGLGSGGAAHGVPSRVVAAGHEAFVYSLQNGLRLGAAVALAGAIVAWTMIGRERAPERVEAVEAHVPDVAPEAARVAETVQV